MSSEPKVAKDVAEAELNRYLEAMDLDARISLERCTDADDRKSLEDLRWTLVRAIQEGHLVINEDGTAELHPKVGNTEPVKFPEPDARALIAMDQAKADHSVEKNLHMLGKWTGLNPERFKAMKFRDFRVCAALARLFLA
ncbi:MAG TPA: hypothetical protein VIM73_19530 [Polyangiaceae bacterium]